jgi:hypothetical protein
MIIILTILGIAFLIVFVCFLLYVLPYILQFHMRSCKYCKHNMEYKGLKEDDKKGHYLFHCPHCGAWEQVPKNVLFRRFIDLEYNPYEEKL